ncbi:MAG: hypothetical protein CVU56_19755 [Deltaproteobacteria bacterium HGW-Deltaproteobacteria-14]|nr:MAG: hypothetical protein CVU56_19755 [Deltaproteobacteria bacterium HGW-Deltaproteobacteria-14]
MSGAEPDLGRRALGLRLCALAMFVTTLAAPACASSPYRDTLDDWTRSEDVYSNAQARAMVRATLETAPFRRAYVDEYARLFALTAEQRAALLEAQLDESDGTWVVIVALYTADTSWNDITPSRAMWEVRLEGPNGWLPPKRVKRLDRKNPTWKRLFPYFGVHFRLFELRFDRGLTPDTPLARAGQPLSLVIAGAVAQMRLSWVLP